MNKALRRFIYKEKRKSFKYKLAGCRTFEQALRLIYAPKLIQECMLGSKLESCINMYGRNVGRRVYAQDRSNFDGAHIKLPSLKKDRYGKRYYL